MRPAFIRAALAAVLVLASCSRGRPATAADCAALLDAIVALELAEQGYRDPALLERRRTELRRALGQELTACAGRRLPPAALQCADHARTTEELTHSCLR